MTGSSTEISPAIVISGQRSAAGPYKVPGICSFNCSTIWRAISVSGSGAINTEVAPSWQSIFEKSCSKLKGSDANIVLHPPHNCSGIDSVRATMGTLPPLCPVSCRILRIWTAAAYCMYAPSDDSGPTLQHKMKLTGRISSAIFVMLSSSSLQPGELNHFFLFYSYSTYLSEQQQVADVQASAMVDDNSRRFLG
jgi:hypothetical protein